ncbi:MAG: 2-oxo acid dehydrogenase subunit E2 [Candidatus Bathyarchaeota archaeon]|nr:MAG: 2-oxo acid dehydrogenase subunit E2 [Candidatus Bathyarchaeota archaeon]
MPRLSLTMKTGTVIEWLKKEGQEVDKGELVVEVLSEKTTYDIEAPAAGVLRFILVDAGSEVPVGATLAFVGDPDEEISAEEIKVETPTADAAIEIVRAKEVPTPFAAEERVLASPAAKRLAREHGVDLTQISGTGPSGRIVEDDLKRFLDYRAQSLPKVREVLPLTGIRKTTAERLASSFQTAPHSFLIVEVETTKAAQLRKARCVSYTSILTSAIAQALSEHRIVNSRLVNGKLQVFEDINIGVAVSTEKGLLVPVITHADKKRVEEISVELEELAEKARQGKLLREQLTGGTFTLTNLGMFAVDQFLPIINPPECAILAAGRIAEKPVVIDKKIEIKSMMSLTLAYDHRIIDGAPAAKFLGRIKEIIEGKFKKEK